jgi:hypothetical protein
MAAVAQSKGNTNGSGSATSLAATFDNPVGAIGRTLVAFTQTYNPSVETTSITDGDGNLWTRQAFRQDDVFDTWRLDVWTTAATTTNALTVTMNVNSGGYLTLAILELDGAYPSFTTNTATVAVNASPYSGAAAAGAGSSGIHLAGTTQAIAGQTVDADTGWSTVIEVDESNAAGGPIDVESRDTTGSSQTPAWTISPTTGFNAMIVHLVCEPVAAAGRRYLLNRV